MEIENNVVGCISPIEGSIISYFSSRCNVNSCIVNIGCYRGRSIKYIVNGIRSFRKPTIYAIDLRIKDEIKEYTKNNVLFLEGSSYSDEIVRCIPNNLDFVFIDGDHTETGCSNDLNIYWKKLNPGGIIMIHDCYETGDGIYHQPEVKSACDKFVKEHNNELVQDHWNCSPVHRVDSSMIIQKSIINIKL